MKDWNKLQDLLKPLIYFILPFVMGLATDTILGTFPKLGKLATVAVSLIIITAFLYLLWAILSSRLFPRRFAVEVYPIDEKYNLAVIQLEQYKKYLPPARRLGIYELPHEAVSDVIKKQLGLDSSAYTLWPAFDFSSYGSIEKVKRVQPPYSVQI